MRQSCFRLIRNTQPAPPKGHRLGTLRTWATAMDRPPKPLIKEFRSSLVTTPLPHPVATTPDQALLEGATGATSPPAPPRTDALGHAGGKGQPQITSKAPDPNQVHTDADDARRDPAGGGGTTSEAQPRDGAATDDQGKDDDHRLGSSQTSCSTSRATGPNKTTKRAGTLRGWILCAVTPRLLLTWTAKCALTLDSLNRNSPRAF